MHGPAPATDGALTSYGRILTGSLRGAGLLIAALSLTVLGLRPLFTEFD